MAKILAIDDELDMLILCDTLVVEKTTRTIL